MAGDAGEIIRRPAVPRPIRVRRNVLSLPANDPILVFYGKAIEAMKKKPLSEPTSWRYQAAIHDYIRADDPNAIPADLPLPADATTFWRACEHSAWFFLPWHRMYLHHFEMMVLSEVIRQDGPTDWALPYWNYSANPASRLLPEAFREGSTTGLHIPNRNDEANKGRPFLDSVNPAVGPTNIDCLREPLFDSGPLDPNTRTSGGFGGLKPATPRNHGGGPWKGHVEASPHDRVHSRLDGPTGGPVGFMGNFTRAPLDPIFWVHHCNIDRLWEVWLRMPGHANPVTSEWRTDVTFPFRNVNGVRVDMTCAQVVDTRAAPLHYIYDDVSNPFAP